MISGGFQAPTGAEPPLERKNVSRPPGKIPEYAPEFMKSAVTAKFYGVNFYF